MMQTQLTDFYDLITAVYPTMQKYKQYHHTIERFVRIHRKEEGVRHELEDGTFIALTFSATTKEAEK